MWTWTTDSLTFFLHYWFQFWREISFEYHLRMHQIFHFSFWNKNAYNWLDWSHQTVHWKELFSITQQWNTLSIMLGRYYALEVGVIIDTHVHCTRHVVDNLRRVNETLGIKYFMLVTMKWWNKSSVCCFLNVIRRSPSVVPLQIECDCHNTLIVWINKYFF